MGCFYPKKKENYYGAMALLGVETMYMHITICMTSSSVACQHGSQTHWRKRNDESQYYNQHIIEFMF
jgi:hypothetical protein